MSCGCLDKENDAKIIEEVQRRKNMNIEMIYTFETILFEGSLQIALLYVDETEIISIEKRDNSWLFHLKKIIDNTNYTK